MKVLITAGPTQEPIDDVRYITNASSGRMGIALAQEALRRGYELVIVHGPIAINLPDCKKVRVRTAQEMIDATLKELKDCDIMISTAAISDYSPKKIKGKIKSGQKLSLDLSPTPKLIDKAKKEFPDLFVVAFKAEHNLRRDELKAVAQNFLKRKGLDLVVANDIEKDVFGAVETDVVIATGEVVRELGRKPKPEVARYIWDEIELHTKKLCP